MKTIYLVMIVSMFCQQCLVSQQTCHRGYRYQPSAHDTDVCVQCENGANYLPYEGHVLTNCYNCTQVENPELEILISKCNITHDTQILCQPGYYRYNARNVGEKDKCVRCKKCENTYRVCEGFLDTICFLSTQTPLSGSNDVVCQTKRDHCEPGQYLNSSSDECLPCPDGSFMSESNHTSTGCLKCATVLQNSTSHSIVVQQCNSTSPTIFGCADGYFRDALSESLMVEGKCLPCQQCQREARKCAMYHDAICHEEKYVAQEGNVVSAHMTENRSLEYPSLPSTQAVSICEHEYYLFINNSDGSSICKPCDNLTSSPEANPQENVNLTTSPHIWVCFTNTQTIHHFEFRTYSIVLFSLAILIDILYVFLYSRNFLQKVSIRYSRTRRNFLKPEKISRLIGTFCLDLHFVFIFVHFFGVLCEVGVIKMDEDTLWTFTVSVGTVSLVVYFLDAILFLIVKRMLSLKVCLPRLDSHARGNRQARYGDVQAMIDSTDV